MKGDLELLGLLFFPTPKMDAFDYWSQLTKLATGLQAYAISSRLFELRGERQRIGQVPFLVRRGERIPSEQARKLAYPSNRIETVKEVQARAFLIKDDRGHFPIAIVVGARFNRFDNFGGEHAFRERLFDNMVSNVTG